MYCIRVQYVYCILIVYSYIVSKLYSFLEAFAGGRGVALGTRHGGAVTRWPSAVSLPGGGFGMNATIGQQSNPSSRSNSTATVAGALAATLNEQANASATYAAPDQMVAGEHDISSTAPDPSVRTGADRVIM